MFRSAILYCLFALLVPYTSCGQGGDALTFEPQEFDLGHLSEDDAPVVRTFVFTNRTSSPVVITRIRTTCGCIVPEYTKEAVAPGEKGILKLSFNPKGVPGMITRDIFVYSSAEEEKPSGRLRITAQVARTTDPYASFRYTMGDLRLRRNTVDMGTVARGKPRTEMIHAVNSGKSILHIKAQNVPDWLEVSTTQERITPDEATDIQFRLKPDKIKKAGRYEAEIYLDGVGGGNIPKFKRAVKVSVEIID